MYTAMATMEVSVEVSQDYNKNYHNLSSPRHISKGPVRVTAETYKWMLQLHCSQQLRNATNDAHQQMNGGRKCNKYAQKKCIWA